MKKSLNCAVALLAVVGACNMARAELVCDDSGTGGKSETRKGCIAAKTVVKPATPKPVVQPAVVATSSKSKQVSARAVPASAPAPMLTTWEIKASDLSIYGAIKRWSDANGWQVSWELADDYPVTVLASFDDNFRGAVDSVLNAYRDADVAPKGCFYENKVLRVVRRVGDDRECDSKSK